MSYNTFFIYLVFMHSIYGINSTCDIGTITNKASDCLKETTNAQYCCFISPLESGSTSLSRCYPYNKEKYYGNLNINYNKELYSIDCGIGSTYADTDWSMTLEDRYSCGKNNPNDYKDCSIDSTNDNSCCFYEGHELKRCYWLGIKYVGKAEKGGYNFVCYSLYLNKINFLIYAVINFFIMFI